MKHSKMQKSTILSLHGLIYTIISIGLLCIGLIREELISSLCGLIFFSYSIFNFFYILIIFFLWKNTLFVLEWNVNNTIAFSIIKECRKSSFFLFISPEVHYNIILSTNKNTHAARCFIISIPIIKNIDIFRFPLPLRGFYFPEAYQITVQDFSHFFKFTIFLPDQNFLQPLHIEPIPDNFGFIRKLISKKGITHGSSSFVRAHELNEIRNYIPGDDPRKINWKVYAHTGSLSIRQGNLQPPPAKDFVFIIYPSYSNIITPAKRVLFDILIERTVYSALNFIEAKKSLIILIINENKLATQFKIDYQDPQAKTKILYALSFPQLLNSEIFLQPIIQHLPKKSTFYIFKLSDPNYILADLIPPKSNYTIILGPFYESIKSNKNQALKFLYLPQKKEKNNFDHEFQKNIKNNIQEFLKRGFNVTKI